MWLIPRGFLIKGEYFIMHFHNVRSVSGFLDHLFPFE